MGDSSLESQVELTVLESSKFQKRQLIQILNTLVNKK